MNALSRFILGGSCQRLLMPLAGSRPAASHFLLYEQEKVTKEKSPLLSATLRFASGDLRWARFDGVPLELAAL